MKCFDRQIQMDSASKTLCRNNSKALELDAVEQLVERGQVNLIAEVLKNWKDPRFNCGKVTFQQLMDKLEELMNVEGLDTFHSRRLGSLARPRRFEIAAALNRLRSLQVKQKK